MLLLFAGAFADRKTTREATPKLANRDAEVILRIQTLPAVLRSDATRRLGYEFEVILIVNATLGQQRNLAIGVIQHL